VNDVTVIIIYFYFFMVCGGGLLLWQFGKKAKGEPKK